MTTTQSALKPGTGVHGSMYSYRDVYLDLDPTYRDRFGRPLVRITMDFHDNELKQNAFLTDKFAEIFQAMGAQQVVKEYRKAPYDITQYQTTHLCGGAVMGTRPEDERPQPLSAELGRAESLRHGRERLSAKRRLQPDRHGRGARLLVGGSHPHRATSRTRGRWCMREQRSRQSPELRGVAACSRCAGAARLRGRQSPDRAGLRADRARPLSDACSPIAPRATTNPRRSGPSPAGGRSRRPSARGRRPTSPRTARPASAPGAMRNLTRPSREGRTPDGQAPVSGDAIPLLHAHVARRRARDPRLSQYASSPSHHEVDIRPAALPVQHSRRHARYGMRCISARANYKPDPAKSAQWNRGAYLVEGPGHCGACHTPKNLLGGDDRSATAGLFDPRLVCCRHH